MTVSSDRMCGIKPSATQFENRGSLLVGCAAPIQHKGTRWQGRDQAAKNIAQGPRARPVSYEEHERRAWSASRAWRKSH